MPTSISAPSPFGRRLQALRLKEGIAQDRLGVLVGLEESSSSARMSRYENGVHEPPISFLQKLATHFHVPMAYFYCEDDRLAEVVAAFPLLGAIARAGSSMLVICKWPQ